MDISQLLTNWFSSEKTEVEPSLLAYVLLYSTKNTTGLADILNYLVSFWEEGDTTCRPKCIELLAEVVTPSQSTLDSPTNNAIITFIGDRLIDPVLVPRCVDILSIVMHSKAISSTDALQLCNTIFTKIKVKKLPQQSRYKILIILGKTLEKYTLEMQRSKINFISGFINCMDGEKDPRNLMVAFELVRAIIDQFDISGHIEDLFEIVFCYFPISFIAPANDPFGITTEDLKASLRKCLASTPYFAFYATPLLIEKLLTTTGSAKKDAMETISLCAPAYGAHAILPHAQDLFNALVREAYQGYDASMVDVALDTIHNVVATLGTGISIANIRDPVEKSIDSLLSDCIQQLKEPELKNARSAAYILRAAASASDPACTSVTHAALPVIYRQFNATNSTIQRKAILDILTELLMASKKLYGSVEDTGYDRDFQTPLLMYKHQILEVFIVSLKESTDISLLQSSLKGIHEMVLMKQFLKAEEMNTTVDHLTCQLKRQDTQLRHLALSTLGVITKLYPTVLGQRTFPVLFGELAGPDNARISNTYRDALEAIQVLATNPAIFKIVINSMLEKLDYACSLIGLQNVTYIQDVTSTLLYTYKAASKDCEVLQIGQKTILPLILVKCIQSASKSGRWYLDSNLIDLFAMVIAITTRLSTSSEQQLSVNDAFKLFMHNDVSCIHQQVPQNISLSIFSSDQDQSAIDITLIFTAIIGNCRKDVQLPVTSLSVFLQELAQTAIQTPSETRKLALAKIAASIVNKWISDDLVACIKQILSENLVPALEGPGNAENKRSTLVILVWIIKSLVIRGHQYGFDLLDNIIKQCGSLEVGKEAADSFITLLHQDGLILNKASHATVSVLFKQRVFNHCFGKLMHASELVDVRQPKLQVNYLLALIHVLQNIPSQIAINEISKLMLPIIIALSSHDSNLILCTLSVAQDIVPNAQDLVVQHLGSFIHALLRLTQFRPANVRIQALECLNSVATKGKSDILSPFKPSVIKELAIALDDKKRIVRKNAVDCREKWYAIGK